MATSSVTRAVLRYHGGKWLLAPWVIENMPAHDIYVEPFGGGANVLLRKDPARAECYNDLDGAVVNVFRVLRDPEKAARLRLRLALTPFSRSEFDQCYEPCEDDVERAAKMIALSFMGHGTDSTTRTCRTGFRAKLSDSRAFPSQAWEAWPASVPQFVDRLRGVVIEQRDAIEVIARLDSVSALFFVDPPYVTSTRSSLGNRGSATHGYRHEMTDDDHQRLAETLRDCVGMVMVCGYESALYDDLYGDWERLERATLADGAKPRVECLWFNPAAWERRPQQRMFAVEREMVG